MYGTSEQRRDYPSPRNLYDSDQPRQQQEQQADLPSHVSQSGWDWLTTTRTNADTSTIQYPEGISSPLPELNENAMEGKFRYDRDFLLQFMPVCNEKPAFLFPLDAFGLDPNGYILNRPRLRHRQDASDPSRQGSIGLGFSPATFRSECAGQGPLGMGMGHFAIPGSKLSSEDRFAGSDNRAASASATMFDNHPTPVAPAVRQGGGLLRERTHSKRGEGDCDSKRDRKAIQIDPNSPEMVDRKVKGLLNKLTMKTFDSISDQIIQWANKSENNKDGRTLSQVIRLVFESATSDAKWSEIYARLCRKMMEQISPNVQDEGIKNHEGRPIAGGQLFRKYLLNRCQEDFERGWISTASQSTEDRGAAVLNTRLRSNEDGKDCNQRADIPLVYAGIDPDYAAQQVKRRGLALIRFIGELFKLWMLTERIIHECVKGLLGNVDNPKEEEMESLCILLNTVGGMLDTPKARAHLDVYFSRMKELTKSPNVTPRIQHMLIDLIELRERKWVGRTAVGAPTTIAEIHKRAAEEKAAAERQSFIRFMNISQPRGYKSDSQTVTEFLERLAKMKMCSTALFPARERQDAIKSIVNDMALQAPEALRKLSLMVRGEGLD